MHIRFKRSLFCLAAAVLLPATAAFAGVERDVIGWVEKGKIMPWGATTKLKMDSGALTSSMHAENIEEFKKDGEKWVRFTVRVTDEELDKEVSQQFERKILRRVKLSGAGGIDRRVSVLMDLCVGDIIHQEQFTLKDRSGFNYPLLIGRRTIEHLGLLDVTRTFTTDPVCDEDSKHVMRDEKESDEDIGL